MLSSGFLQKIQKSENWTKNEYEFDEDFINSSSLYVRSTW
jgi:hypothetical protein